MTGAGKGKSDFKAQGDYTTLSRKIICHQVKSRTLFEKSERKYFYICAH
jgi:hypothetical protein